MGIVGFLFFVIAMLLDSWMLATVVCVCSALDS